MAIRRDVELETPTIERGRKAVWAIIGIAAASAVFGVASNFRTGEPFIVPMVRTVLTIGLMYFLYYGYAWARWVAIVGNVLAVLLCSYAAFTLQNIYGLAFGLYGAVCMYIAVCLFRSEAILAFFSHQRARRRKPF